MSNPVYIYVVVRKDMSPEMQMVQSCHAGIEAGYKNATPEVPTHLVLLAIDNEKDLIDCSVDLQMQDLKHEVFFEPDNQLGYTALATWPTFERNIKAFKGLKLWSRIQNPVPLEFTLQSTDLRHEILQQYK